MALPMLPPDVPAQADDTSSDDLVPEQFAPPRLSGIDPGAQVATGPSEARHAELFAERARLQAVANSYGYSFGQQSQARRRIREINAELAGNADQKAVVAWLKARAKQSKGGLDVEATPAALALLPGWGLSERLEIIEPTEDDLRFALGLSWKTGEVRQDYNNKQRFDVRWPVQDAQPFALAVEPRPAEPELGRVYATSSQVLAADTIYPRSEPLRRAGLAIFSPRVGMRILTFHAPDGSTRDVIERPRAPSNDEPLAVSPTFWRWAYAQGLAEAAAAALSGAEAAVPKAASIVKVSKGRGTCPVCFAVHAVTKTLTLMDHGYQRPGWGHNVAPCEGTKWPQYEESPSGSENYRERLERHLAGELIWQRALTLRRYGEDGKPVILERTVYVRDAQGKKIVDTSPAAQRRAEALRKHGIEAEVQYVTRMDKLLPGDKHYEEIRGRYLEQAALTISSLRRTIPLYRAAVRIWRKGGVPLSEIYDAAKQEDP